MNTIRLDDLAKIADKNSQYFCRYFKENTGYTVTAYINEVRVNHAIEYLLETSDRLDVVSENTGFENVGYFIRKFKEMTGMTPSVYRRTFRKQS